MDAYLPWLHGYLLVMVRATGLVLALPTTGGATVSARLRAGLAAVFAGTAWFAAGSPQLAVPGGLSTLVGTTGTELVLGLSAGLGVRLVLESARIAGGLADLNLGLSYGSLVDPLNGATSTALAQLLYATALGVAVALNLHGEAVAWLARSVIQTPPGTAIDLAPLAAGVIRHAFAGLELSTRLAFPVLAVVTLGHIALGLVGRLTPQLGMQNLGLSVTILLGGATLYAVAPSAARLAAEAAVAAIERS